MRLLVLAPQPFMAQRGTPIAVEMMASTLADLGNDIDLLVYGEGDDVEIDGCRIFRVPLLPGLAGIQPGFSLKKVATDAIMFPMVALRLMRERYDLIIAVEESAYMAMLLRPIFRVPYIMDVDSSIPEQIGDKYSLPRWLLSALSWVERRVAKRALAIVVCCEALRTMVREYAPDAKVQVLEDVTLLANESETTPPEGCDLDKNIVMYVGNLESYQGVELLIDGFAKLDQSETPSHLVIVGGAQSHIDTLSKRVSDRGISEHVSFLGPRPVEQLSRHLHAAAVTVSPRIQGRNTPMKIYSYLDSGRPVLATRLPTHTQVLDDEIAMLVEPTPEDMARGLSELLSDEGLRTRLSRAARTRVAEEYSPDAYHRKLAGFFENTVAPILTRHTA